MSERSASTLRAIELAVATSPCASFASARSSPVKHARLAALQHVAIGLLVELRLPRTMNLLLNIHAVDHLADGVAQAGCILFKLDQLIEEVLRQHKSLRHVVLHGGSANRFLLLLAVSLALALVARQFGTFHARGNLVVRNSRVHRSRFDRLDQALDHQRHRL